MICQSDIEEFTEDKCWALAFVLNEMTGLPMMFFGCSGDEWYHVAIQVTPDLFLDVKGFHDSETILRSYAGDSFWECRKDDRDIVAMEADGGDEDDYESYSMMRAREVAPLVLSAYPLDNFAVA